MADLADALQTALASLERDVTVSDVLGYMTRAELAEELSGTSEKSSQEYRSASRLIQRWTKGRGPKWIPEAPSKSARAQLRLIDLRRRPRPLRVTLFDGEVQVSTDRRRRLIRGVNIPRSDVRTIAEAHGKGEEAEAAELFEVAFMDAYGLPGGLVGDVDELELREL